MSEKASSWKVTITSVSGGIETFELQRARISREPTETTWSTTSPRNARASTRPVHEFAAVRESYAPDVDVCSLVAASPRMNDEVRDGEETVEA